MMRANTPAGIAWVTWSDQGAASGCLPSDWCDVTDAQPSRTEHSNKDESSCRLVNLTIMPLLSESIPREAVYCQSVWVTAISLTLLVPSYQVSLIAG
jgi:hypothetical protein